MTIAVLFKKIKELQDELKCTCTHGILKYGRHDDTCMDYLVDDLEEIKEEIGKLFKNSQKENK
jgi:hypothetical protein